MNTIKDIIGDYALGKYKNMTNDELIDCMQQLIYIIDEETTPEEKLALKKPYWSLVYRIANGKGLMWDLPRKKKEEKTEEENKTYRKLIRDKKTEESKPEKNDN
ncbi:hypothetical protein EDI_082030 [Entamoeba dispar SAW760]|uniref:Uncharacterized protein n=1 Tax=Entamoeba dispar (strain ATCC PRA-260 / SAW760) TaxID=370354 RepID=B0ELL9_ENTDS|nr:uncharacterized protein EDI_082030 [Entamoeba dispar SAW760]EDR24578.1 hypothetical protein EDI_082030 [Entamoeba dispar SAW760]|eukprot:EDR24578.1 hypothetical protein EDI_082030 [Entamoeba dispar SAW760]